MKVEVPEPYGDVVGVRHLVGEEPLLNEVPFERRPKHSKKQREEDQTDSVVLECEQMRSPRHHERDVERHGVILEGAAREIQCCKGQRAPYSVNN